MNSTNSTLHRPPVSTPTTTSLQLFLAKVPLVFSGLQQSRASVRRVRAAAPVAVKTLWIVMSTAKCAPRNNGKPLANTSMARSSLAETVTFMSRSLVCHLTVPHDTQASARSGPTARVRNIPDLGRSVFATQINRASTLASSFRHIQRESQSLKHQSAEQLWLQFELQT